MCIWKKARFSNEEIHSRLRCFSLEVDARAGIASSMPSERRASPRAFPA